MQINKDVQIVEALVSDRVLVKLGQSGGMSSIIEKIKDYVVNNIKQEGVINLLAPGILGALGHPVLAIILKIAETWFGFDLGKIFGEIVDEVKSLISSHTKTTSEHINNVVHQAVMNNIGGEPTQSDYERITHKASMTLEEAKLYNLAVIGIMQEQVKEGQARRGLAKLLDLRSPTALAITSIIGWLVKVVLWAGGLMVADDVVHSILGSPKHDTSTTESPAQTETTISAPPVSTQTTLKVNPNYNDIRMTTNERWIEPVPPNNIADDIVQWTKDIYPDTKNLDAEIHNSPSFQQVVQTIDNYNRTNTTDITFMPKIFTSRKNVVDRFIDEVAQKAPQASTPEPIPLAQPVKPTQRTI